MAEFKLNITLGNHTMQTNADIADALCTVQNKLYNGKTEGNILDINGNTVGFFTITGES